MIFPLYISSNTRIFGGVEKIYLGNTLLKIRIPHRLDYGALIRLPKKGGVISPYLSEKDVYFRLVRQPDNFPRINVCLALPLSERDFEQGTRIDLIIKTKRYKITLPRNIGKEKILRLRNLAEIIYGQKGDIILVTTLRHHYIDFEQISYNPLNSQEYKEEIAEGYEESPVLKRNLKSNRTKSKMKKWEIVVQLLKNSNFKVAVIIGLPFVLQIKFEASWENDIKRLGPG